jgi:hypothetical protein
MLEIGWWLRRLQIQLLLISSTILRQWFALRARLRGCSLQWFTCFVHQHRCHKFLVRIMLHGEVLRGRIIARNFVEGAGLSWTGNAFAWWRLRRHCLWLVDEWLIGGKEFHGGDTRWLLYLESGLRWISTLLRFEFEKFYLVIYHQ